VSALSALPPLDRRAGPQHTDHTLHFSLIGWTLVGWVVAADLCGRGKWSYLQADHVLQTVRKTQKLSPRGSAKSCSLSARAKLR
jgi:hypothetical protein